MYGLHRSEIGFVQFIPLFIFLVLPFLAAVGCLLLFSLSVFTKLVQNLLIFLNYVFFFIDFCVNMQFLSVDLTNDSDFFFHRVGLLKVLLLIGKILYFECFLPTFHLVQWAIFYAGRL
jgi:hypothetical protein